ncbi:MULTISPECIES: shikimate kinase [unclassified Actinobaculum]|uniref:shikimate kinase n=1 Tax=unclassified Actinobaculum TaxID=2609299 RepID=UPI000D5277B7|nr:MULTISPECIES: shikimate kinase [unclassified Actinobaculum]AWE42372.1 hypothetical protein DDD63_05990 [Actinobaculum sp. 313]RTE50952.1 hypothetical protein EKN07_02145 [Actinobaculum sp. 352]
MSLILIGPPGAWAPEVAEELSQRWQVPSADTDAAICALAGRGVADIAVRETGAALRELERNVALALLDDLGGATEERILALGSGCLGNAASDGDFAPVREKLSVLRTEGHSVVYLSGDAPTLLRRLRLDGPHPASVFAPRRVFFTQLAARREIYRACADAEISTDDVEVKDVADAVERYYRQHSERQ